MLNNRKIQSAGKGWLVLKLYSDLVDNNDTSWKRDKTIYTRLNKFKEMNMSKADMKTFLKDVINGGQANIRHVGSNSNNKVIVTKALATLKVL